MAVQTKILSPAQIKCIYTLARKGGLDNDTLHVLVNNLTGKDSIKLLASRDAAQVIDALKRLIGQEPAAPRDRASDAQAAKILSLAAELGWADDPCRLRSWLESRYHASHPRFLNKANTNNCIQAMKAMLAGGRGERKKARGADG